MPIRLPRLFITLATSILAIIYSHYLLPGYMAISAAIAATYIIFFLLLSLHDIIADAITFYYYVISIASQHYTHTHTHAISWCHYCLISLR